jgi:hypothetical protein
MDGRRAYQRIRGHGATAGAPEAGRHGLATGTWLLYYAAAEGVATARGAADGRQTQAAARTVKWVFAAAVVIVGASSFSGCANPNRPHRLTVSSPGSPRAGALTPIRKRYPPFIVAVVGVT